MNKHLDDLQCTPEQAFLIAINEAAWHTAMRLVDVGIDPKLTWRSFESALSKVGINHDAERK